MPEPREHAAADQAEQQVELFREATTMAVYVSISLLAVLAAIPLDSRSERAITVGLTGIALLLAHWLAARITSNFNISELKTAEGLQVLAAQVGGGLLATVVAVVPLLVLPAGLEVMTSAGLLVLLVCAVSFYAARVNGRSVLSALAYSAAIIVVAAAIVALKSALEH
ncbi:MAG: hypothetical protein ACH36H_01305 [Candidatus Nanopelagicales bacterium]